MKEGQASGMDEVGLDSRDAELLAALLAGDLQTY
jgi:hypothetical protein